MQLLKEISQKSLGINDEEILGTPFELRKSARGIIINNEGLMALQHLTNRNYHKLPGGGVDPGETEEEALAREIIEEVGYSINTPIQLGVTIEYRNFEELLHISYGYSTTVIEKIAEPSLEANELDEGQETIWVTPQEAIALMRKDTPVETQGKFILAREICFLEKFLEKT